MNWLNAMMVSFLETTVTPVTVSDFQAVLDALSAQISVDTIVGVLAALVGAVIGIVFMWWGVRKVASMVMSAFRKGRVSV